MSGQELVDLGVIDRVEDAPPLPEEEEEESEDPCQFAGMVTQAEICMGREGCSGAPAGVLFWLDRGESRIQQSSQCIDCLNDAWSGLVESGSYTLVAENLYVTRSITDPVITRVEAG